MDHDKTQFWISILYLIGSHVIDVYINQARQQGRLDDVAFLETKSDDIMFRVFCGYWILHSISQTITMTNVGYDMFID